MAFDDANFIGQEGGFGAGQGIEMGGGWGGGMQALGGQGGFMGGNAQNFQAGQGIDMGGGLGGGFGQMFGGQGAQGGQFGAGQGMMGMGGGMGNRPVQQQARPQAAYPAGRPQQQGGGMTLRPKSGGGGGGGAYNPYTGAQQTYSGNPQQQYAQYMNNYQQYANAANQAYNNQYQNAMAKQQYQQNANAGAMASKLYSQQQDQYNQAKQANIDRYNQTLAGYDNAKKEGMGYIDQMGKQQTADANMRYQALGNKTNQSAISRGLGNSTVVDSLQRGVQQDQSAELRRINEGLLGQRLGVQQQYDTGRLNTMASRVDSYPDQNGMNQLAMMAGKAGVMPQGMG